MKARFNICSKQVGILPFSGFEGEVEVSDERASFIIKSIMAHVVFTVYVYKDKVVKGQEILGAVKKYFSENFVYSGKLFEELNGKNRKGIASFYKGFFEESHVIVNEIDRFCNEEEVQFFLDNI